MMDYNRKEISRIIVEKLVESSSQLKFQYEDSRKEIGYFFIDDLLPEELANLCFAEFPEKGDMKHKKSLRENKFVSAQMDRHPRVLEEVLYAFQGKEVVEAISKICGVPSLYPDKSLYAGGLSLMEKDNFLLPHLDNSHDAERNRWRVLNLLYYVSPDWNKSNGGHLELWPEGPKHSPIQIESKFNRLVVMATHEKSWHSVNKVLTDQKRCCISNYYFSDHPLKTSDNFHVTQFRARPKDRLLNYVLIADSELRMLLRKVFKKGVVKNPHVYKGKED